MNKITTLIIKYRQLQLLVGIYSLQKMTNTSMRECLCKIVAVVFQWGTLAILETRPSKRLFFLLHLSEFSSIWVPAASHSSTSFPEYAADLSCTEACAPCNGAIACFVLNLMFIEYGQFRTR